MTDIKTTPLRVCIYAHYLPGIYVCVSVHTRLHYLEDTHTISSRISRRNIHKGIYIIFIVLDYTSACTLSDATVLRRARTHNIYPFNQRFNQITKGEADKLCK